MRLSELKTGERGVIVKVTGNGAFRKRVVEMGFVKGQPVEVIMNAPLKDPIEYRIMGYEISLRRSEAAMVEIVSEAEAEELYNSENGHSRHAKRHASSHTENGHAQQGAENENEGTASAAGNNGTSAAMTEKLDRTGKMASQKRREINVALVGNPNCGKTSLFNIASGAHEHVGNYSGVTVDAKMGHFDFQGYRFNIVDLPGTYSLSAYSPEELYVRKYIVDQAPDVIINVVDASNLERNLYLTTQLIDMNTRMIVALNMYDTLKSNGDKLDHRQLGHLLGMPVVPTTSRTGEGIENLFHIVISLYEGADFADGDSDGCRNAIREYEEWHNSNISDHKYGTHEEEWHDRESYIRHIDINYGNELEKSISSLSALISENDDILGRYSARFLAIKLLENDAEIEKNVITGLKNEQQIKALKNKEQERIQKILDTDSEQAVADAKYGFISGALKETLVTSARPQKTLTNRIDSIVTHKVWGFPIFIFLLYLMFEGTYVLGEYPMMWIEWIVEKVSEFFNGILPDGILKSLVCDGIIGGVGGVIVFLPNILLLYLFISVMEDTGYMARAAFIMDKLMHKMGLHGKSFIPLIMGFGCNVPAIMATRIIESRKSRLVTILVNPLMSCSARLPIYIVMIGAFFSRNAGLVLFSIYFTGILLAILLAKLFSRFIVKGEDMPFVMELPPYRLPSAKSVLRHTWEKGVQYLKKIGGIIMAVSIVIWFLGYFPRGTEYETVAQQQENSYIGKIGKFIEPAIEPLGFDWKMGIGLLSGIGAKELVVSTLGVLYAGEEGEGVELAGKIPITPLVAYAYMLFVLVYFPCVATVATIRQETGSRKWAAFAVIYTTALAWLLAFAVYQIGSLF